MKTTTAVALLCVLGSTLAQHGGHQIPIAPPGANWQTRHMVEEHHITEFDADSFFILHDFDSSHELTPDDIGKTYGFFHESTNHIPQADKDKAIQQVIALFDTDGSGTIDSAEFRKGSAEGKILPDFGYGPGHHGDDEYEYEIHHWELYHDENTREEDLTHPEDIEHFRKHDLMDEQAEKQEKLDKMRVIDANIPQKFRRM